MLTAVLGVGMFALGVITPLCYIRPVYAPPPILDAHEVERVQNRTQIDFGRFARLVGYDVGRGRVRAGQAIAVTLYWQCLSETRRNYTVAVKVLGADGRAYGAVNLYPGRGNFATSLWRAGDLFRETYWAPVSIEAPAPCLGQSAVSLFDAASGQALPALGADGRSGPGDAVLGRIKVRADGKPRYTPERPLNVKMGADVALLGYSVKPEAKDLTLHLYWQALTKPADDLTVFVHFTDADGRILAQADGQPRRGAYPTSLWDRGETVEDEHVLTWPDTPATGPYRVSVGMYRLQTMGRLPVFDADGGRMPNDEVPLDVADAP